MEPFRFTAQAITFAVLIAVVAAVVALAAPFGSIALGAVALLALGAVLIKAMFRSRRWWPLTAVEGTVAVSCLVLVVGGLGVVGYSIVRLGDGWHMMVGWPDAPPALEEGSITRSVSYSDPAMQQELKDRLREAGVPFTVNTRDGKEFVGWAREHAAAAMAVDEKMKAGPLPAGRNVHFPDPKLRQQFVEWLAQKGIKHEVVKSRGEEYVVWNESAGDLAREFIESRGADCRAKIAAAQPGPC